MVKCKSKSLKLTYLVLWYPRQLIAESNTHDIATFIRNFNLIHETSPTLDIVPDGQNFFFFLFLKYSLFWRLASLVD